MRDSIIYRRIEDLEDIDEVVLLQREIWSPDALRNTFIEALLKGYIITGVQKVSNSLFHNYILEYKTMEELHD